MFNIFIQNELKLEKKCLCSIALKLFFHFRNNFSFNHKTFKKSLHQVQSTTILQSFFDPTDLVHHKHQHEIQCYQNRRLDANDRENHERILHPLHQQSR
jgi:hypothetical protein